MSLTYAANQPGHPAENGPSITKSMAITAVVLLHIGFLYAFTHGLKVVDVVAPLKNTVAVFIPDEQPPQPPPAPQVKPVDIPIEAQTTEMMPPVELAIEPELSVTPQPDTNAITPNSMEVTPARSFSITQRVSPQYPAAARRAGQAGTVVLSIVIAPNGIPSDISIERSSGYAALDESAVAAVRKWRFTVTSDTAYSRVSLPVTFKLES